MVIMHRFKRQELLEVLLEELLEQSQVLLWVHGLVPCLVVLELFLVE